MAILGEDITERDVLLDSSRLIPSPFYTLIMPWDFICFFKTRLLRNENRVTLLPDMVTDSSLARATMVGRIGKDWQIIPFLEGVSRGLHRMVFAITPEMSQVIRVP